MTKASQPQEEPTGQAQPSEEELRAALEEQLRQVRVQDLLLESVASIVNLTARRIAKEDERDLEQARVGIEAVRAVVDLLEPEPAKAVREALSELQCSTRAKPPKPGRGSQGGESDPGRGNAERDGQQGAAPESRADPKPPPQRRVSRRPRLWTPPGSA